MPDCSLLGCWGSNWTDGVSLGAVELHELGKIELWLLEDLDLTDEDVLEWEDFIAGGGDLPCNIVGEALLEEIFEG